MEIIVKSQECFDVPLLIGRASAGVHPALRGAAARYHRAALPTNQTSHDMPYTPSLKLIRHLYHPPIPPYNPP